MKRPLLQRVELEAVQIVADNARFTLQMLVALVERIGGTGAVVTFEDLGATVGKTVVMEQFDGYVMLTVEDE